MRPVLVTLVLAASSVAAADGVKIVVLGTRAERSGEKDVAGTLTELIVSAVGKGRGVNAVGEADVVPFLDEAAQKQLKGCEDDAACLVEIGGAIGADYLVSTSLGALGKNYVLSVRLLDAKKGTVAQRVTRNLARSEDALGELVCPLIQEVLIGAGTRDPRIGGDVKACSGSAPTAPPEPVAKKDPAPAAPVAEAKPKVDVEPTPAVPSAARPISFTVQGGWSNLTGIAGIGLQANYSHFGVAIGSGTFALTGSVLFNLFPSGTTPYLAVHTAMLTPGLLAPALPTGAVRPATTRFSLGGTLGIDWRPIKALSVKLGVGLAYSPYEGTDPLGTGLPKIFAWDVAIGPVFGG